MKVLLAVGGGIAAYKSAELARLLMQQGHQVQVVMTRAAEEFVRPLTFAALTGRKVLTNLFAIESAIDHVGTAQEHELRVLYEIIHTVNSTLDLEQAYNAAIIAGVAVQRSRTGL